MPTGSAPADDIDLIMAVMHQSFDPEFGEAWNRRQIEDALLIGNCHYLLAGPTGENLDEDRTPESTAAGFALSRTGFDEEELLLLAVAPQYRRRGVGALLLSRLAASARERGANRLLLEMRRGNPAEALYRADGFEAIGLRPKYYRTLGGDLLDAITFSRRID